MTDTNVKLSAEPKLQSIGGRLPGMSQDRLQVLLTTWAADLKDIMAMMAALKDEWNHIVKSACNRDFDEFETYFKTLGIYSELFNKEVKFHEVYYLITTLVEENAVVDDKWQRIKNDFVDVLRGYIL